MGSNSDFGEQEQLWEEVKCKLEPKEQGDGFQAEGRACVKACGAMKELSIECDGRKAT